MYRTSPYIAIISLLCIIVSSPFAAARLGRAVPFGMLHVTLAKNKWGPGLANPIDCIDIYL